MTQTVSTITLLVPDYDAGIAFYVDKLGFDLREDTKLSETKRWVRVAPKGAGVTFLEDPRHETYGSVVVFQDPFGNKWDLIGN